MAETKIAVLTVQDENWGDDGGDHECFILSCDEQAFITLKNWSDDGDPIKKETVTGVIDDQTVLKADLCPMMVHGVFNIWTSYE